MATLFVGPRKLLSNVQNVIRCSQMGYDNARKGNFKRKVQKVFYLPNTILMKRFRKIQETQIVIIFASKCIGWTQGGGGKAVPPTQSFLSTPSFLLLLLLRSESKRRTKTSSRNGAMSPNLPSLQIPNERVFFPFNFFFFFANASNILTFLSFLETAAYWKKKWATSPLNFRISSKTRFRSPVSVLVLRNMRQWHL